MTDGIEPDQDTIRDREAVRALFADAPHDATLIEPGYTMEGTDWRIQTTIGHLRWLTDELEASAPIAPHSRIVIALSLKVRIIAQE